MWPWDYCCHVLVIDNGWSTAHFKINGDRKRQKICGLRCKQSSIFWAAAKPGRKAHFRLTDVSRASWLGNDVKCTWYLSTNTFFFFFWTCWFWLLILIHATNHATTSSEWDLAPKKVTYSVSGATTFLTIIIITFQPDTFTASTK